MEHSSKRRRLSGATKGTRGNSGTGTEGGFAKAVNGSGDDDEDHGKDIVDPSADYYPSSAPSLPHLPELDLPEPTPVIHDDLRRRQSWAYPGAERWHRQGINPVVTAIGAVETVVTSVYEIIIDQGTTSVGEFTVPSIPTAPTVIVLPTFGTVTIPVFSQPTQSQSGLPVPGSSGLPLSGSATLGAPGSTTQFVITAPSTPLPTESASISFPTTSSEASAFPTHTGGGNSSTSTFTATRSGSIFTGTTAFSNSTTTHRTSSTFLTSTLTSHLTTSATASQISSTGVGGVGIGGAGGTPTNIGTSSTGSPSSTAVATSSNNKPPTPAVVGGVVGGFAGLTVFLVLILLLVRWRKRRQQGRLGGGAAAGGAERNVPPDGDPMAERTSDVPFAAAGLAPFFRRLRPHSGQTSATSETGTSERGFQNFGGRKIESVLTSGGDGYGDIPPGSSRGGGTPGAFGATGATGAGGAIAGSTLSRDFQAPEADRGSQPSSMFVGPGSPPASVDFSAAANARRSAASGLSDTSGPNLPIEHPPLDSGEVAVMRPSPARTPVTSSAGFAPPPLPRTAQPPPRAVPSPIRPSVRDGIGRSHPSLDGSRGSRFAENL